MARSKRENHQENHLENKKLDEKFLNDYKELNVIRTHAMENRTFESVSNLLHKALSFQKKHQISSIINPLTSAGKQAEKVFAFDCLFFKPPWLKIWLYLAEEHFVKYYRHCKDNINETEAVYHKRSECLVDGKFLHLFIRPGENLAYMKRDIKYMLLWIRKNLHKDVENNDIVATKSATYNEEEKLFEIKVNIDANVNKVTNEISRQILQVNKEYKIKRRQINLTVDENDRDDYRERQHGKTYEQIEKKRSHACTNQIQLIKSGLRRVLRAKNKIQYK